jgi:hypothetical protein
MFRTKTADQIVSGFMKTIKELEKSADKFAADADRHETEAVSHQNLANAAKNESAKASRVAKKIAGLFD